MKQGLLTGLLITFGACLFLLLSRYRTPPDIDVVSYDPILQKTDVGWLYEGQPFSGYMVEREKDGLIVYRLPILNGQENGLAKGWYNTGEKLLECRVVDGKKEGMFKQWWPNGHLRYVLQYRHNQYDGPQLVFFPDGNQREKSTYVRGQPEGHQRVWNKDGQLMSNYIVRNQKTYGLIAGKSCLPVMH